MTFVTHSLKKLPYTALVSEEVKSMAKEGKTRISCAPVGGGAYFITYIGAAIYFMHHAHGFWGFVYALLKAAVWPAIVLYRAMMLLKVG